MKPLPDRVEDVVIAWCGITGFPTSIGLSVLWSNSVDASTVPFPQAIMKLIPRVQSEFHAGQDARDLSGLNPGRFAPAGTIDTVDDLVSFVLFAPKATPHALILGFAHDDARQEFVNAIADEVVKRLQQPGAAVAENNDAAPKVKRSKKTKDPK